MDIMLCKEEMNIHAPLPVLFWVRVSCFLRTKKREAALGQAAKETKKQEALMSLVFTCLLSLWFGNQVVLSSLKDVHEE